MKEHKTLDCNSCKQKTIIKLYKIHLLLCYSFYAPNQTDHEGLNFGHPYIIQQFHQLQFATSDQMHN